MNSAEFDFRICILKKMDECVRSLGDEDILDPWLMCGVPDAACDDDFEFIAAHDDEWRDVCDTFINILKTYG